MEYVCNTIEEYVKASSVSHNAGDIFLVNELVWNYIMSFNVDPPPIPPQPPIIIDWPSVPFGD